LPCGEQGKLPTAKAFKLAERDKTMSEQKLSYMQELDEWTDANVVMPLADPSPEHDFDVVVEQVKKAIRGKVLESYKNGLKAPRRQEAAPRKFAPRRPQ